MTFMKINSSCCIERWFFIWLKSATFQRFKLEEHSNYNNLTFDVIQRGSLLLLVIGLTLSCLLFYLKLKKNSKNPKVQSPNESVFQTRICYVWA